jgi:hypothetical protein
MFVASMFVEADHASSRQPGNRACNQCCIHRPGSLKLLYKLQSTSLSLGDVAFALFTAHGYS